ncbi:MAG: sigma-70 family RNA polymerase sigma factor [bacterium]|jgi:RNA polymerase sigma-B factor
MASEPTEIESEELELFREYKSHPSPEIEAALVKRFEKLVYSIMKTFNISPADFEDIRQVGLTGLLLAIRRYDPETGNRFSTFAFPTIRGEIQRHYRDKRWAVNVPRRLKELSHRVFTAQSLLAAKLGQEPSVKDISAATGLTDEEVIEAMELGSAYNPKSFYDNFGDEEYGQFVSSEKVPLKDTSELDRQLAWKFVLGRLTKIESEVIRLRFFDGLTQKEVADKLDTSQMCISRIQRTALAKLRTMASEEDFEF